MKFFKKNRPHTVIVILGVLLITYALAIGFAEETVTRELTIAELSRNSAGYGMKAPSNVQGVVNRAHSVVVGKVTANKGARSANSVYVGSESNKRRTLNNDIETNETIQIFELEVENVLVDDGFIGETVLLTAFSEDLYVYNPKLGERYLFALFRQPDDLEYGYHPAWGMFDIGSNEVVRGDGTVPEIVAPSSSTEFVESFRYAAENRIGLKSISEWNEPYADLSLSDRAALAGSK